MIQVNPQVNHGEPGTQAEPDDTAELVSPTVPSGACTAVGPASPVGPTSPVSPTYPINTTNDN